MATRAAGRSLTSGTKSAKTRKKKAADPRQSAFSVIQARIPDLADLMPPAAVFNRDLVGAISALVGLVTAWAVLARQSNGILVEAVDNSLSWICGRAPYVIPVLSMLLAYQCFRNREGRVIQARQILGGLTFGLSVTGLTHAAATGSRRERGGVVGEAVFDFSHALVGDYAAGIGLFAIGVLAVFVTTNTSPMLLYREIARIGKAIYKPLPPVDDTDLFDTIPPVAVAVVEPEPAVLPALVINNPKKESSVKKSRDMVARSTSTAWPRGSATIRSSCRICC
jgi:hypothetical protein